ncbi:HAMP domain-containing histidine kinase [Hymenobacter busanensis]|uniref:histidine kinase n=1 Tax=Hymenobacter busanensis TaxID=2607656 RepID=A0A7L4ZZI1_9BACT|nr:HAMP domain-containing sensor histidine kinase [Hymenobacter busanensis]KAA9333139.1 HAMP domain-containing histidine kinase [Hymenobacter busanensis]QHJ08185.1 HAMP domain-containing protein [Hymenobacter busanensis]
MAAVFRPLSLRRQLLLGFGGVLLLLTLLAGGYQYLRVRQLLLRADDNRLRARATNLLGRISLDPLPTLPLPDVAGEQMRVVLALPNRPAWELFRSPGFPMGHPAPAAEAPGVAIDGQRVLAVARPAAAPGVGANEALATGRLTLWLAHPAAPLNAELRRIRLALLLGLLGSAGLAAVLAAWLGGVALRPLRRISAQAQRIQNAAAIEPLPVPATGDEVQTLAETLNAMLTRLQAQAALQDNFLAAAAHELRTPLATLQLGLEVTGRDAQVPAAVRAVLAGHGAELRRLGRLVEDFLLVSRLRTTNALPLHWQEAALDELVLDVVDRVLPQFRAAARTLHLHLDDAMPDYRVRTDVDKLTTIVLNLLDNARKHAAPGAAVQVHLGSDAAGRPVLRIRNALLVPLGPNLARLTTPYYQADVWQEGAGLGLWISSRLAEALGLTLDFTEAEGELLVTLRFPLTAG